MTIPGMLGGLFNSAMYALDTPGALTRGALAGRPGTRASGRDMLESWGALRPNTPGLDFGDVAGFAADVAVDPLNLLGTGVIKNALRGNRAIKAANTEAKLLHASMPARASFQSMAGNVFGHPAQSGMALTDAHANRWAQQTGQPMDDWYKRIGGVQHSDPSQVGAGALPSTQPIKMTVDGHLVDVFKNPTKDEVHRLAKVAGYGKGYVHGDDFYLWDSDIGGRVDAVSHMKVAQDVVGLPEAATDNRFFFKQKDGNLAIEHGSRRQPPSNLTRWIKDNGLPDEPPNVLHQGPTNPLMQTASDAGLGLENARFIAQLQDPTAELIQDAGTHSVWRMNNIHGSNNPLVVHHTSGRAGRLEPGTNQINFEHRSDFINNADSRMKSMPTPTPGFKSFESLGPHSIEHIAENQREYLASLPDDVRAAVEKYKRGSTNLNPMMRGQAGSPFDRTHYAQSQALQRGITNAPGVAEPVSVWREVGWSKGDLQKLQPGDVVSSKGFVSTSVNRSYHDWEKPMFDGMEITVPAGMKGMWIDSSSALDNIHRHEAELVLPIGTDMRFVGTETLPSGKKLHRFEGVGQTFPDLKNLSDVKAGDKLGDFEIVKVVNKSMYKMAREEASLPSGTDWNFAGIEGKPSTYNKSAAVKSPNRTTDMPLFQGKRGAVEFGKDNKAVIHAFQGADISTMAHETSHVFRRSLAESDPQLLQQAEQAMGAAGGQWTRQAEEGFASGFERYLRDGAAPTPALQGVFGKFKEWLTGIYRNIAGTPLERNVSPQMKQVFDTMLSPVAGGKEFPTFLTPQRSLLPIAAPLAAHNALKPLNQPRSHLASRVSRSKDNRQVREKLADYVSEMTGAMDAQ